MTRLQERHDSPDSAATVVAHVRDLIDRGALGPGGRLPAERDLAQQIGVSRPTVRAGLRALAAMGVVRSRHGSGTYIPDGPPALGVRAAELSGRAARLHARGDVRSAAHPRGRRGRPGGRARDARATGHARRRGGGAVRIARRSAACSSCTTSTSIAASPRRPATRSSPRSSRWCRRSTTSADERPPSAPSDRDLRDAAEAHRQIYQAMRARDADRARRAMNDHLVRARSHQATEGHPCRASHRRRSQPASSSADPRADRRAMTPLAVRSDWTKSRSSSAAPAASAACSRSGSPTPARTSSRPDAGAQAGRRGGGGD